MIQADLPTIVHRMVYGLLLLSLLSLSACNASSPAEAILDTTPLPRPANDPMVPMTDVDLLTRYLKLTHTPTSAMWVEQPLSNPDLLGPTDYTIIAVLQFDEKTLETVQGALEASPPLADRAYNSGLLQPWYPEAIRSAFVEAQDIGTLTITEPLYNAQPLVTASMFRGVAFIASDGSVFVYVTSS